ncbi:hypothetical protein GCM10027073_18020 [Streptomyces chlorus]
MFCCLTGVSLMGNRVGDRGTPRIRRDTQIHHGPATRTGRSAPSGPPFPYRPARRPASSQNAETPVSARPMTSFWIWLVPS